MAWSPYETLLFIAFPSEQKAEEVGQKILTMQKESDGAIDR